MTVADELKVGGLFYFPGEPTIYQKVQPMFDSLFGKLVNDNSPTKAGRLVNISHYTWYIKLGTHELFKVIKYVRVVPK